MKTVPVFRWSSACISDVGRARTINEDACLEVNQPRTGLWAVADGMGGHAAGEVASRMVVEAMQRPGSYPRLDVLVNAVQRRMAEVNERLLDLAGSATPPKTMGSTVVVLVALRRQCACLWAGDSRAYRLREGWMQRMTRDHSRVEELIESGEIPRSAAENHPAANVVTRAVGVTDDFELEVGVQDLKDGDRYLLCSDGLYKELSDEEIAFYLHRGDARTVCRGLVETTLARGARDNVTVVVVDFEQAS